ncbi:MAG: DUF6042 family protein [Nakamurella sp.]
MTDRIDPEAAEGAAVDEFDELEDELEDDLEPWEETLEDWEYLGWLDVLPAGLMAITGAFDGPTTTRVDFDRIATEMLAGEGLTLLDGDPLWPVLSADLPDEDRLDNHEQAYGEYLEEMRAQRSDWAELITREPGIAVASINELADRLVGWGLLSENGDQLELVDPVPDPLNLLPLTEDTIGRLILDRMGPEMEAVEDVLHEFLYHGESAELATTLRKLADQADVTTEIAQMTVAMLISQPDSGVSAQRFGPLDTEGVEVLKEHQKFTLRVDRTAPGFADHEH